MTVDIHAIHSKTSSALAVALKQTTIGMRKSTGRADVIFVRHKSYGWHREMVSPPTPFEAVDALCQGLGVDLAQVARAIEQLSERRIIIPVQVLNVAPMSAGG